MESYIQLTKNGKTEYKPAIEMYVRASAKDSDLPQPFGQIKNPSVVRNVTEIWRTDKDIYTEKITKTLVWQRAKVIEIATELGNTLPSDSPGEKYFIRVDSVPPGDTIKEDKNAQHLPIDGEQFVNVHQNDKGEDVVVG